MREPERIALLFLILLRQRLYRDSRRPLERVCETVSPSSHADPLAPGASFLPIPASTVSSPAWPPSYPRRWTFLHLRRTWTSQICGEHDNFRVPPGWCFVSGYDFSRAAHAQQKIRALAPAPFQAR